MAKKQPEKAVILCAGLGERLRPLTETIPKPMIPIAGKPVLEHLISLCRENGITDIAVNTSYLPEKIRNYFGDGSSFGVNLIFSYEPHLLGTAGALNNFRGFLNGSDFLVIYGDNVTNLNLRKMIEAHQERKAAGTIYLYHETMADSKTTPGCVVVGDNSFIKEIIEHPTENQQGKLESMSKDHKFTNSGIYVLSQEILNLIPEGESDFARQIFPDALHRGLKIYGYQEDCYI